MPALAAFEFSHLFHLIDAPFNLDSLAVYDCIRYFPVSGADDISKSLPGDIHFPGRLVVVHPLKVRQTNSLEFIHSNNNFFQGAYRYPSRLEITNLGLASYFSAFEWSRHTLP